VIAEAVDTIITLGWALLAWIALTVAAGMAGLYAVVAVVTVPVRAACRAVSAGLAASRAVRALAVQPHRYRPPQTPSWAAA
jgi:hypothetical protein